MIGYTANKRPSGARLNTTLQALCPLLCGLLAAAPLWGPGIIATRGGGDSPFLLQRTMDMAESLRAGIFPVRWMSHAAYDLGYPFFSYYAALPYYMSGALTALGLNLLTAIQTTQTLGFILAALSASLWARRLLHGSAARMLLVTAYTFAPFHLVNVYVRGDSLSEFYAFIWFPLILWSLDRLAANPTWSRIITAAMAYGGLVVTHNVSALIFSPFALGYGLVLATHDCQHTRNRWAMARTVWGSWMTVALPFVLGFAITAWFWLPAIVETEYGQMGTEFTAGYFHYSQHFRGPNLVQPSLTFDYGVAGNTDESGPFAMGLCQACAAMTGSLAIATFVLKMRLRRGPLGRNRLQHTLMLGGVVLSTAMITPLSSPLWDHVPLLALAQFPWRFLSIQALFAATVTAVLAEPNSLLAHKTDRHMAAAGTSVLLIVAALAGLRPDRLNIAAEDVTWESLRLYEAFTGNIGTTIRYEYLPEAVVPRLYTSEALVDGQGRLLAAGETIDAGIAPASGTMVSRKPTSQTWVVRHHAQSAVTFPINWWPGWHATADGIPVACYPMVGSGRLTIDLPPGEATVVLQLHPTPLQRAAELASLGTALGIIAIALGRGWRPSTRRLLRGLAISALLLACAVLGPALLQRPLKGPATFFDFIQLPFAHRGPIIFGQSRLLTAKLSAGTAAPGDRVTVDLTWDPEPTDPLTLTVRLVSPATPRHGIDLALAQTEASIGSADALVIQLPDDLARGLYFIELRVTGPMGEVHPSTAQGLELGVIYIGALRVPKGPSLVPNTRPIAALGDIHLLSVESDQTGTTELRLRLQWATPGTPRNWSLSLRVLDLQGRMIVQQDLQPGYGYLPTTLWNPNERIVDTVFLTLPEGLAPGTYTLRVITYLEATMQAGGQVDIPITLTVPTLWDMRGACCEQTRKGATVLCQTDEIALLGLDTVSELEEGADLPFLAEWNALRAPTEDLISTWFLLDSSGAVLGQLEAPLAVGSRTSEWPRHTWVLSPQRIDLPQSLPHGPLELHLSLRGDTSGTTTCGRVSTIEVSPRPRQFVAPTPTYPQTASFGEAVALLGYDLGGTARETFARQSATVRQDSSLSLTIWWQASQTPSLDLKRFVHLFEPETESIATQEDAMPRAWTYPTTLWVAGEVVSETVTLDLASVEPGTYRLGLGWYDPASATRLKVTATEAAATQSDRLTLWTTITVRP